MVMGTKMEKDGDKNEDRLRSLETDFSNSNFSPGDEKADETEAGVGLEVDQKENCEQNAKQKTSKFWRGDAVRSWERAGHPREVAMPAKLHAEPKNKQVR